MTLPAIFATNSHPATDCIVWTGAQNSKGYGCLVIDGVGQLAHRVAWEDVNGPIPDGMTIDHLCRVRCCVNADHMEVVTVAENNRRKRRARGVGDVCKHGHRLDSPDAIYVRKSGATECRACIRDRRRAA